MVEQVNQLQRAAVESAELSASEDTAKRSP